MLSSKRLRIAVAEIALALISASSKSPIEFSIDAHLEFHSALNFNSTAGATPGATTGARKRLRRRAPQKAWVAPVTTAIPHAATAAYASDLNAKP
jgi:hypothetical protein